MPLTTKAKPLLAQRDHNYTTKENDQHAGPKPHANAAPPHACAAQVKSPVKGSSTRTLKHIDTQILLTSVKLKPTRVLTRIDFKSQALARTREPSPNRNAAF